MADAPIQLRRATVRDVDAIAAIVNDYAEQGLMLHRSLAELYESLRDYQVATDGEGGAVAGVVGLRVMWSNLAEVYALAVSPAARGRGVGRRLVEAAVAEAEQLGIRRVFALTYEQAFFERCGFMLANRLTLPEKVWSECVRCPKNEACDEIAVVRVLEHVADLAKPIPATEPHYDVPILSEGMKLTLPDGRRV